MSVEIHASSLNPADSAIHAGSRQEMVPLRLPAPLGGDIAGNVFEVAKAFDDRENSSIKGKIVIPIK